MCFNFAPASANEQTSVTQILWQSYAWKDESMQSQSLEVDMVGSGLGNGGPDASGAQAFCTTRSASFARNAAMSVSSHAAADRVHSESTVSVR